VQCPQCRQSNDHNARFCVQCGARVRASACASCGSALPATARFCPECGTAVAGATPAPVVPRIEPERDPAEALLTARDVDGVEEELPSPEDAELLRRVREDRARTRTIRRSVVVAGVALLLLLGALVLAQRAPRTPITASAPPAAVASAPAAPNRAAPGSAAAIRPAPPTPSATATESGATGATPTAEKAVRRSSARVSEPPSPRAEAVELPARDVARAPAARSREPQSEPAALPEQAARRPASDVRVEVTQAPNGSAVDYTVKVTQPDGAPVRDADVRLRGVMVDGVLVEARLDPASEPGVYRSLVAFSPRGPHALTLRVARDDGVVEVPVGNPASGRGSARP
jgi:hypothetical protein